MLPNSLFTGTVLVLYKESPKLKKANSTTSYNLCNRQFFTFFCQTGAVEMLPYLNNKTLKLVVVILRYIKYSFVLM